MKPLTAYEITWDDVLATAKAIAPKLADFTLEEQELIIDEVNCHVPETYGKLTKILRRYWAAHVAEQSTLESAGEGAYTSDVIGAISSAKNQPVNNPNAKEYWGETHYGRAYFNYIADFRKHNIVSFGIFSGGQLQGFSKHIQE